MDWHLVTILIQGILPPKIIPLGLYEIYEVFFETAYGGGTNLLQTNIFTVPLVPDKLLAVIHQISVFHLEEIVSYLCTALVC